MNLFGFNRSMILLLRKKVEEFIQYIENKEKFIAIYYYNATCLF